MASNLDFAEDIEEAKVYMAKKNYFQLFEVRYIFHSSCFEGGDWLIVRGKNGNDIGLREILI